MSDRVEEHFAGRGSPLVKAALDAGHEVKVARKWLCGTRDFERFLKNLKRTRAICPCCTDRPRRVTFAAFGRFLARGGRVRPSRGYYALAAMAGVTVDEVLAMSAEDRRAIKEAVREAA